jgi:two-component system cell cycle sensor histidine kinase/response regulator CckA
MKATDAAYLVDGKYAIGDLVDLAQLRDIFEKFTRATGFTIGFLDHPGLNILIATGWRDICTKFHRGSPASAEVCLKSNKSLLDQLIRPNQLVIEPCDHGLFDCATPIIIKGKHIASLATGQLLLAKPDPERFRRQARLYGYDEKEYLAALGEIPVVSEEQLRNVTAFLGSLAVVVSEMGYAHLETKEEAARLEREVAARILAEEALRSSERKYRMLHESMRDAFVSVAMDGRILEFNPVYQNMLGYTQDELFTKTYSDLTPGEWHAMEARIVAEQVVPRGYSDVYIKEYRRKDGTVFPVELRTTLIQDDAGHPVAMWAILRDITERKRAEELRLKMETQMLQVQKLESLGVLAGGIAHDFNNLLTGILGNVDLALTDVPSSSPIRENLSGINMAARQAAELCRQMLAYSGKGRFVIQTLDLRQLVREIGHMLEVSISKKVALRYKFSDPVPAIEADSSQIRQLVMNLIINASESIGEQSGVVTVTIGAMECDKACLANTVIHDDLPAGQYVYLEVADTGCGMDEATQARVFDPFFTTKFTGRGLGLAAVLGIVRGHKGCIKIYSEKGRGTAFKVLFPAVSRSAEQLSASADIGVMWKGAGTILLADDERTVRDIGKRILERLGFHVILASDGDEAVRLFGETEAAHKERIACVILDLTMPNKDGVEAFREIRALRGDVPVILSSGYNEQEVTQRFVGRQLSGFIQKPYQMKEMAEKLQAALGV